MAHRHTCDTTQPQCRTRRWYGLHEGHRSRGRCRLSARLARGRRDVHSNGARWLHPHWRGEQRLHVRHFTFRCRSKRRVYLTHNQSSQPRLHRSHWPIPVVPAVVATVEGWCRRAMVRASRADGDTSGGAGRGGDNVHSVDAASSARHQHVTERAPVATRWGSAVELERSAGVLGSEVGEEGAGSHARAARVSAVYLMLRRP